MEQEKINAVNRNKERLFLLLTAVVLGLFFARLFYVEQRNFTDVSRRLEDGTMVNLNAKDPAKNIRSLLEKGYYFDDKRDIDLVENIIANRVTLGSKFENIGELNKKKYNVDAEEAISKGGKSFQQRVAVSRALLGYTGDDSLRFIQETTKPPALPNITDVGLDGNSISGKVLNKKEPVAGVLVRLHMILPQDSTYNDEETDEVKKNTVTGPGFIKQFIADAQGKQHLQGLTAFARTDNEGVYTFKNLPANKAFEVLPLQPGYQFGRSLGTENLDNDETFNFYQQPHQNARNRLFFVKHLAGYGVAI